MEGSHGSSPHQHDPSFLHVYVFIRIGTLHTASSQSEQGAILSNPCVSSMQTPHARALCSSCRAHLPQMPTPPHKPPFAFDSRDVLVSPVYTLPRTDAHAACRGFDGQLLLGVLPVAQFSSGHTYFVQRLGERLGLPQYAVHATFQFSGTPGKRNRMRERLLWTAVSLPPS